MNFGMKLWCFKSIKLTEPDFFGKKNYFGEKVQKYLQNGWHGVYKTFNSLVCTIFGFT